MSPDHARVAVFKTGAGEQFALRAVFCERKDYWVGQFLEIDVGAEAKTLSDLMYEMQRSLVGFLAICAERGVEPFEAVGEAPQAYHDLWEQAAYKFAAEPSFRRDWRDGVIAGLPEPELKIAVCA